MLKPPICASNEWQAVAANERVAFLILNQSENVISVSAQSVNSDAAPGGRPWVWLGRPQWIEIRTKFWTNKEITSKVYQVLNSATRTAVTWQKAHMHARARFGHCATFTEPRLPKLAQFSGVYASTDRCISRQVPKLNSPSNSADQTIACLPCRNAKPPRQFTLPRLQHQSYWNGKCPLSRTRKSARCSLTTEHFSKSV